MVTLTGFGDEISPDLKEQMDVMESEGIRHIELRAVWNTGVHKLSEEQRHKIKEETQRRGFRISSLGSGLGKIKVDDDFGPHVRDCEVLIQTAKFLGTPYIRIFSFYVPQDQPVTAHRDEVMRRVRVLTEMAAAEGIVLGHENERHIYGEKPEQCRDLLDTINSPSLRAIFDPANFVQAGVRPFEDAWPILKNDVLYFHIKDAKQADGRVTPAGEGDGGIKAILSDKLASGWEGFLSLEPHLKIAGPAGGYSGPLAFKTAAQALKRLLDEIGVRYH
ncbi:MAG: Xylose isomerase-like TIM barrel [Candidatus Latescibacteria bacterium ADurb.Bin168]|nr:MAG: Xylose isomerase-like TIM barrel [Candidatus Latescibacteria bacterium ADurb.Bin168]